LSYGSSAVVAASNGIREFLIEEEHLPAEKITVIRNAVETTRFADVPPAPFGETLKLLAIGRLEPQKGHDVLLNALAGLRDVPWELTLVGEGSARDDLVDIAVMNRIHDRVHFVGTHLDVEPFLAACDVVVMPSRWEGIGLVIMEGMAAGRPVVASRIGGIPELIDDKKNGLLVPIEDVAALQEALRFMWTNQSAARALGAAARVKAQQVFDVRAMVAAYERVYAHLAHQ
jgi:glycosyltransferase involved in cell wall biosynthesis